MLPVVPAVLRAALRPDGALLKGAHSPEASAGVDAHTLHQPVGVVAGITPFNIPVLVPLWMLGNALACGNAFVLKPSEKDPSASLLLAELVQRAGFPDGLFDVVQGDAEAVDTLLTHPGVAAVSFVGSTAVARHIDETGTRHGKRVQALGGAENHMVVLPDADLGAAADAAISAAGEGARVVVDGSTAPVEDGFFVGCSLLDEVEPGMRAYDDEIFGPVLGVVRAETFDEAVALVNANPTATGSPCSPATGAPPGASSARSRSAWWASTCRSPCRSPPTPSAGGRRHSSATRPCTAPRASASTPGPRSSRPAGPTPPRARSTSASRRRLEAAPIGAAAARAARRRRRRERRFRAAVCDNRLV